MKVLIIHNGYCLPGGEDSVVASEQAALSARGHQVISYYRNNREFSSMPASGKALFLITEYFFSRRTARELSALIEREKPDIVHVHNIFYTISPSVYTVCRKYAIPIVQTLHNYRYLCPNALFFVNGRICQRCLSGNFLRAVLLRCRNGSVLESLWSSLWVWRLRKSGFLNSINRYIALSEFSKSRFVAAGFDESRISVKPNFVKALPKRLEAGSFVLYAGALVDYKGVDELMRIIERSVGIPFVIAGQGPKEKELRNWLSSLDNRYIIEFKGQVSADVMAGLLSNASVLLFTSRCYENFPRIIVEAFSCGVPVLASDTPVMKEIIEDGNGELYGTVDDASQKLKNLFFQKQANDIAGKKAMQCYVQKYTQDRNMDMLESIYKSAVGKNYCPPMNNSAVY